jgi:probable HAF family extracellular repeat protein
MKSVKLMCITAMAFLVALAIPVSLAAQAQPQKAPKARYRVRDLGTLGGTFAVAGGISNNGWVEGYSLLPGDVDVHEFLWHEGVMTDLGTLGGSNSFSESRPNDRGDAGGLSETSLPDPYGVDFCGFGNPVICLALLWRNGVMTAQPTLGGNNGAGFGTNDRGDLVGTAENSTPEPTCVGIDIYQVLQYKPVIWRRNRVIELPTFPGDPVGMAYAINDRGEAVGLSGPCGTGDLATVDHALLWRNGTVTDLGNLGGTMFHTPNDINNRGEVVGLSDLPGDTTFHGFLWRRGVMKDLGTLPGDVHSNGEGINCKGQVVGRSSDASFDGRAILWENGVMTDLNTLIPANSPLFLLNATSINDRGQIVGGALTSTGEVHAFLATPRDSETDGESATTAAARKTVQRPNITLPENLRKLLERRGRLSMPQ